MPGGRRKSREILFRVLYETEQTGEDPLEALEFAFGRYRVTQDGRSHALSVIETFRARREDIDRMLRDRLAHWQIERLSTVVRSILRLSLAELLGSEVPARVALDQAVELAKKYGEEGADGFVNGVLDPIAGELRPGEMRQDPVNGRAGRRREGTSEAAGPENG